MSVILGALGVLVVNYSLQYTEGPRVHIRIELPTPGKTLIMPRAIPMGYGEQPYDRFVSNLRAFSPKGEVQVKRQNGPRWSLGEGAERIEYDVDVAQMEREVLSAADASKVRPGYLGVLGYTVFGLVEGFEDKPAHLEVTGPRDWPVFLTLCGSGISACPASDFYALADSQIVMGPKLYLRQLETKPPLYLAVYFEGDVDLALAARLASQALESMVAYFGTAPFRHYTVHLELLTPVSDRHRYGFSMEHLESGTFYLARSDGLTERSLYNFAHHMAHAWIPKRAYGEGYFPFNWELAPVLDTIWFSEGFGQYAAVEALAPAMPQGWRDRLIEARFRSTLKESPAFLLRMPLVDLSRIASTRYAEDFRTGRLVFSRGALMAAEMDEYIRARTSGRKSLRDALRGLMAWSARNHRGFRIEELPAIFAEATGVDTREILERWLRPLDVH